MDNTVELRSLQPGDKFYAASSKNKLPIFTVMGNCEFNRWHESFTRLCMPVHSNTYISKSCNLKVVKV